MLALQKGLPASMKIKRVTNIGHSTRFRNYRRLIQQAKAMNKKEWSTTVDFSTDRRLRRSTQIPDVSHQTNGVLALD